MIWLILLYPIVLQKKVFDQLYKIADIPFLQNHKFKILVDYYTSNYIL